jgi:predicted aconitase with swiveling domain
MSLIIKGRAISRGKGTGELLVSRDPITFLSGVDPETGVVIENGHPLKGESVAGRVLAFPFGKGSTVGSYIIYALMKNGKAPVAIINTEAEPIIAVGAIIAGIPMIDRPEVPLSRLKSGVPVTVDGESGECIYEGDLD